MLINGLVKDDVTHHYDVDVAYLQDFSLQFFERCTSWFDDLEAADAKFDEVQDDEGESSLKDNPLYKFAKRR